MHHALHLEEILLNIFGYCHPSDASWTVERSRSTADLAVLARTCHTFKKPALDVLWSELIDLSPLAFCLPERRRSSSNVLLMSISTSFPSDDSLLLQCYSFTRPRNDAEWDTLRSYTRRVWRIVGFSSPKGHLDPNCISETFNSPLADPFFPNLRFLIWQGGTTTLPVMHFAVPLLTSLNIRSAPREDAFVYTNLLDTLVPRCPDIQKIRFQVADDVEFGETVYHHLCSWNRLQVVDCFDVTLPADVMVHLSSMSTLLWLSFTLHVQSSTLIPTPSAPLVFSRLVYLEIVSESLASITSLVAQVRLPAIQVLIVPFSSRPSRETVDTYFATLGQTCASNTLTDLRLLNLRSVATRITRSTNLLSSDDNDNGLGLNVDDFRPCMTFGSLRAVHVNLEWSVSLTDNNLLALVSAWPHVEHLVLNDRWGWRTTHGITLDGLQQILQRCRFLWEICVALDTESAVEPSQPLDVDLSSRKQFRLNVADSPLRQESVPALRTTFSVFGFSRDSDRFFAWDGSEMGDIPGAHNFRYLWKSVFF